MGLITPFKKGEALVSLWAVSVRQCWCIFTTDSHHMLWVLTKDAVIFSHLHTVIFSPWYSTALLSLCSWVHEQCWVTRICYPATPNPLPLWSNILALFHTWTSGSITTIHIDWRRFPSEAHFLLCLQSVVLEDPYLHKQQHSKQISWIFCAGTGEGGLWNGMLALWYSWNRFLHSVAAIMAVW